MTELLTARTWAGLDVSSKAGWLATLRPAQIYAQAQIVAGPDNDAMRVVALWEYYGWITMNAADEVRMALGLKEAA